MSGLRLDPGAVLADLDELASRSGGRFAGAKRLAWTQDWLDTRMWLERKLAEAGLDAKRDPAGNLWARVEGEREEFLIVGSHIDAVPDGGWLDGALGVLTAVEAVRQLARAGTRPPAERAVRGLGRRGGGAVRTQPARLIGLRGNARTGRGP